MPKKKVKTDKPNECDDCGKKFTDEELKEVRHLSMRVDPGGTMPSGECPKCGALCYPVEK